MAGRCKTSSCSRSASWLRDTTSSSSTIRTWGDVTREGCLLPLEGLGRDGELAALARQSVGASFESYRQGGRLWAVPVDAAAQVQAWRADRLSAPPRNWDEVMSFARDGLVSLPMRPPHALLVLFTLAANLGHPCAAAGKTLVDLDSGREVYERIRALMAHVDPSAYDRDPIAELERLAEPGAAVACIPYTYGYVSYAFVGFRPARVAFADIPDGGGLGPIGSALGGTGLAISARSAAPEAALDFALWVAGAEAQRGPYAAAGGQPGNAAAWQDGTVNEAAGDFYRATRATMEGAWVRPRHDGYIAFQDRGAARIVEGLRGGEAAVPVLRDLNRMYAPSFS